MVSNDYLLSDSQMKRFISQGFIVLQTDISPEFHQSLQSNFEEIVELEGNPGNNALPRMPEMQEIFRHPVITGALSSVLGSNYIMHPHRHCHFSRPGRVDQNWHKDSYWGYQKIRNHHNWWAMIFYYPQETTDQMGPSGLIPGSQYYAKRAPAEFEEETHLLGQPGTFALIHYDLWHRGTSNVSNRNRTMMKFQFVRMDEPTAPAWNNEASEWTSMNGNGPLLSQENLWRQQWQWHRGERTPGQMEKGAAHGDVSYWVKILQSQNPQERVAATEHLGVMGAESSDAIPALIDALTDPVEPVAVGATYALSTIGESAVLPLIESLKTSRKSQARNAGYALSVCGRTAIGQLIDALGHDSVLTRGHASFALGELGASAVEAAPTLAGLTRDTADWVRRAAVEALGTIKAPGSEAVSALSQTLVHDSDDQVRFTSALSLTRLGPSAEQAVKPLGTALKDDNRYVRANAVDALRRIDTVESREILLDYLMASRWCATTTPKNLF